MNRNWNWNWIAVAAAAATTCANYDVAAFAFTLSLATSFDSGEQTIWQTLRGNQQKRQASSKQSCQRN